MSYHQNYPVVKVFIYVTEVTLVKLVTAMTVVTEVTKFTELTIVKEVAILTMKKGCLEAKSANNFAYQGMLQ